ncbi:hypothetical protein EP10_002681 [Geobacillus icigianus]|uniref:Uncharacterized protein n=1 Tax=Geobacillus icigianus TaxID=1430331 RepID=A0ABU6BIT7_9BACL|nr:hypothetical protein [Geobacillus icigianus]
MKVLLKVVGLAERIETKDLFLYACNLSFLLKELGLAERI